MSDGILFDNFIITDNKRVADQWAADSWQLKKSEENSDDVGDLESSGMLFYLLLLFSSIPLR